METILPTSPSFIKGKIYIVMLSVYITLFEEKIAANQVQFEALLLPLFTSIIAVTVSCSVLSTILSFLNGDRIEKHYDKINAKPSKDVLEKWIYYLFSKPILRITILEKTITILRFDLITSYLSGYIFYLLLFNHLQRYPFTKLIEELLKFSQL